MCGTSRFWGRNALRPTANSSSYLMEQERALPRTECKRGSAPGIGGFSPSCGHWKRLNKWHLFHKTDCCHTLASIRDKSWREWIIQNIWDLHTPRYCPELLMVKPLLWFIVWGLVADGCFKFLFLQCIYKMLDMLSPSQYLVFRQTLRSAENDLCSCM